MMKNDFSFGEWLWQWYKLYKKDVISEQWQKQYERAFILHVPQDLFNTRLCEINALQIDLALYELGKTRTASFMYSIYSSSLTKAYQVGFMSSDVGSLITKVKYRSRKSKPLTQDEIDVFFDSIKDYDLCYLYKFLLLTGCRRSEALNLKWSDVDYKHNLLIIRGTKTVNSNRVLPLTFSLELFLRSVPRTEHSTYLFPFNKTYVSKFFHQHCPNHKLHDLRHTFATRCARSGVHPSITQAFLGHATPEFTLKVYTHISAKDYVFDLNKVQKDIFSE